MNWKVVAGLLAVALVASLVGLGFAMRSTEDRASVLASAAEEADEAARKAVVAMTTYDWTSLEEDFGWAEDAGTEKFQEYYDEVSAPIKELVAELKVRAEGTVVDSAARAEDEDHVTVLLFVDQTLSDETNEENRLDQPRVSMTMVREGDRWLVDGVAINNLTNS